MAVTKGITTCGHGFGWGNGCGLLRSDWVFTPKTHIIFLSKDITRNVFFSDSSSP